MEDIDKIRSDIRALDSEFATLFKKRMEEVEKVAKFKIENNKKIYNKEVEARNIDKMLSLFPEELKNYVFQVYTSILETSKAYQAETMGANSSNRDDIIISSKNKVKNFPLSSKVACQGEEGAYSQMAADKFFKNAVITYYSDFKQVFDAVNSQTCQYGILPIENSTAGSVNEIYDLMQYYKFFIVRSLRLKINHNLLVNDSVESISQIKKIYSHPQAIAQCRGFLDTLNGVEVIPYSNTAAAAKMVANSKKNDIAAISSYNCAKIYSLKAIKKDIQDFDNNFTRFICISKKLEIYDGANRSSFMMILPHTPGSLFKVLSTFYSLGINLNKIESRSIANRNFEFRFYFDLDMQADDKLFSSLFKLLDSQAEEIVYLGSYSEII